MPRNTTIPDLIDFQTLPSYQCPIAHHHHKPKWETQCIIPQSSVSRTSDPNIDYFIASTPDANENINKLCVEYADTAVEQTSYLQYPNRRRALVHSRQHSAIHRIRTIAQIYCLLVREYSQGGHHRTTRPHQATFNNGLLAMHATPTKRHN